MRRRHTKKQQEKTTEKTMPSTTTKTYKCVWKSIIFAKINFTKFGVMKRNDP